MPIKDKYQETFDTWDKVASRYEDKFMPLTIYDDTYENFCASLKKQEASVLEIGCGPGNITKRLLALRPDLKITGLDVSENMIALARKNNPEAAFITMDCRDLHTLEQRFDGIINGFTLSYLSAVDCSKLMADCGLLLYPKGTLYISFVAGSKETSGYIFDSQGNRTYFYYYSIDELVMLLENQDFRITSIDEKEYEKSPDLFEQHIIIQAEKN